MQVMQAPHDETAWPPKEYSSTPATALLEKQVGLWRRGAQVRRYHTMHTTALDTVGGHSGGVAYLCGLLAGTACTVALLQAALMHDLPEYKVGDIPSPTKNAMGGALDQMESDVFTMHRMENPLDALNEGEKQLLSFCDAADGALFCIEEMERGNLAMKRIALAYLHYIGQRSKIIATVYPLTSTFVAYVNIHYMKVLTQWHEKQ